MAEVKFTRDNIALLFGQEDSAQETNERLNQYFVKTSAYEDSISNQNVVLLVGHKGSGKSATLAKSHYYLSDKNISIVLEPTSILAGSSINSDTNYNAVVSLWQERIQQEVAKEIIANKFGLADANIWITKISTAGSNAINVLRDAFRQNNGNKLSAADNIIVSSFVKGENNIFVHIDDLDQGWTSSKSDISKISAILSAIRSITKLNQNIKFRITLRSDIYYLVRTSDESTDKIEGFVSWVNWSGHDILVLLSKRILTYFGESPADDWLRQQEQSYMSAKILSRVMDSKFVGRGKWASKPIHNILTSLVRRSRPRDMVKLLTMASNKAGRDANKINSIHLNSVFESYSNGRLIDIENEYKSELPNIGHLIRGMKPNRKQRFASDNYVYNTAELTAKIKAIKSNANFNFTNGNVVSERALIQFLYKIDFITARKEISGELKRHHFDSNQFLITEVNDMGFDWEVHPAYRWALQPDDPNTILDGIDTYHGE